MQMNEKVALIAGVDNRMGMAVSRKLKSHGWKVIGADIAAEIQSAEELDAYYSIDMTDRKGFIGAVRKVEETFGPIIALFCATGFENKRQCAGFLDTSIEQWQKSLDGWLGSSINACAAVAPGMAARKEGRIMILSPDYSRAEGDNILTAAAAGTLHGFAKSFGVEMARENVLVNCLWPNIPFDEKAVSAAVHFLAESGNYVSAQVISLKGREQEGDNDDQV